MAKKTSESKVLIITLVALAILILISGVIFAAHIFLQGRTSPGLKIGSLEVSLKNQQQAHELIGQKSNDFINQEFSIIFGEETMTTTPGQLGIGISSEKTVEKLIKKGHFNADLLALIFREEAFVPASYTLDPNEVLEAIDKDLKYSLVESKNANFIFNENGALEISKSHPGLQIDKNKLIKELKGLASDLQVKNIEIQFEQAQPEITEEMLQSQLPEIKNALNHQIKLVDPIYSDPWFVRLNEHKDWVVFEENKPSFVERLIFKDAEGQDFEGTHNYISLKIDPLKLNEFIDAEISQWLDTPVDPVNIYTDEDGEVVIEGVGIDGTEIEREKLHAYMELALAVKATELVIPIKTISPELNISQDLQELGITEIIGVGHTSFYGSPANRVHNIKVGAQKFDGDLLAPDEVYSFNTNLGAVDASTGFRKELVIKPEGTIPEYGGGICQVSTTLYRAILFSDLGIVERNSHSYAVGYYSQVLGHGLDATIYLGGPDLQFMNDTGHHLLMQFYVKDDYELYVIFYGTQKDFSVEMEGPYISGHHNPGPTQYIESSTMAPGQTKQVEKPHTGFNVVWYKHLSYEDGSTETKEIVTKYKAVPAKILVAPGEKPN